MAVPTVPVFSMGQALTSVVLNQLGTAVSFALGPPRAVVYRTTTSPWASGNTPNVVTWQAALTNSDNNWAASPNGSRLTCNTPGQYFVEASVHFTRSTGDYYGAVALNSNASWVLANALLEGTEPALAANFGPDINIGFTYFLNAGDYVEFFIAQTSGSSNSVFAPAAGYFGGHFGITWKAAS